MFKNAKYEHKNRLIKEEFCKPGGGSLYRFHCSKLVIQYNEEKPAYFSVSARKKLCCTSS